MLAVLGPGVALQRLARARVEPCAVVPLGMLFCAGVYWLSLVTGSQLVFPAAVGGAWLALAAALVRGARIGAASPAPAAEKGPSLRGALPAVLTVVAILALTQYRVNRVDPDGAFRLDLGEHVDTAVHVGVTWELVAGYPPQVPGFAGVPMQYHVGTHLVRAAAARWAALHPYDGLSRFDVTLWAIALVLALRAAAFALGLGEAAVRLAGFVPLAADLSFVPGLLLGAPNAAMKLGGNFVEAVLFANSIAPAMAAALAALVLLRRAERGEGLGCAVLAAALAAGCAFLKAFTGAQLLLALALAWLAGRASAASDAPRAGAGRHAPTLALAVLPLAVAVAWLALGGLKVPGTEGVRVDLLPFAPTNPARVAFGLPPVQGLALVGSGLAWLGLSLGLRVFGIGPALRAWRSGEPATAALGALGLVGWPIALFVSVSADPDYDESFYFLQASGLVLYLLALPALAAFARRSWWRAALLAALALPATLELVAQRAAAEPERIAPPVVRAMAALRQASCPGDIVLARPGVVHVPPVVVLGGRRVPLALFIPYWRQFTSPGAVAAREAEVFAFYRSREAGPALDAARRLGARYVLFGAPAAAPAASSPGDEAVESALEATGEAATPRSVRDALARAGALVPVHVEPRAAVYRLGPLSRPSPCARLEPGPAARSSSRNDSTASQ